MFLGIILIQQSNCKSGHLPDWWPTRNFNRILYANYLPTYMGPPVSLFTSLANTSLGKLTSRTSCGTWMIPYLASQKKASPDALNASTRVQEHRNDVILQWSQRKCTSNVNKGRIRKYQACSCPLMQQGVTEGPLDQLVAVIFECSQLQWSRDTIQVSWNAIY